MNFKSLLSLLPKSWQLVVAIVGCTYYGVVEIKTQIDISVASVKKDFISEARVTSYEIIKNQIDKQLEKIDKDPDDIKVTDIKFIVNQCRGDFSSDYMPKLPPNERITIEGACNRLESMYTSGLNYK